jgi:hypothetical protein
MQNRSIEDFLDDEEERLLDAFNKERAKGVAALNQWLSRQKLDDETLHWLGHEAIRQHDMPASDACRLKLRDGERMSYFDLKTGNSVLRGLWSPGGWAPGSPGRAIADAFGFDQESLDGVAWQHVNEDDDEGPRHSREARMIHLAVEANDRDLFDWLLAAGASPDPTIDFAELEEAAGEALERFGPPLAMAARLGREEMAAALLKKGADPSALYLVDLDGEQTPTMGRALEEAIAKGDWACARLLAQSDRDAIEAPHALCALDPVSPTRSPGESAAAAKIWLLGQARRFLWQEEALETRRRAAQERVAAESSAAERARAVAGEEPKGLPGFAWLARRRLAALAKRAEGAGARQEAALREATQCEAALAVIQADAPKLKKALEAIEADERVAASWPGGGESLGWAAAAVALAAFDAPSAAAGEGSMLFAGEAPDARRSVSRPGRLAIMGLIARWPGALGERLREGWRDPIAAAEGMSAQHFAALMDEERLAALMDETAPIRPEDNVCRIGSPAALAAFGGSSRVVEALLPRAAKSHERAIQALPAALLAAAQGGQEAALGEVAAIATGVLSATESEPAAAELAAALERALKTAAEQAARRARESGAASRPEGDGVERAIERARLAVSAARGSREASQSVLRAVPACRPGARL